MLNKSLVEYNWHESALNLARFDLPQKHGDNRWQQDGFMISNGLTLVGICG